MSDFLAQETKTEHNLSMDSLLLLATEPSGSHGLTENNQLATPLLPYKVFPSPNFDFTLPRY